MNSLEEINELLKSSGLRIDLSHKERPIWYVVYKLNSEEIIGRIKLKEWERLFEIMIK